MSNDPRDDEGLLLPAYAGRLGTEPLPRARLADEETPPLAAYRFVHDELVLEVAPGEVDRVRELVVDRMHRAIELSVPLDVSTGHGGNWDAAAH